MKRFLEEDLGKGDVTSSLLPRRKIKARIISRQQGIVAGAKFAKEIFAIKGCRSKIIRIIAKDIGREREIFIIL